MHPVSSSKNLRFNTLLVKSCAMLLCCAIPGLIPGPHPAQTTTLVQPVLATPSDPVSPLTSDDANTISTSMPDDRFAGQQWSFHSSGEYTGASGLFNAREFLAAPTEVVVAIVDSGVMLEHEDLNFLPGYDFIDDTSVANDSDGRDHDPGDPGDWVNRTDIDNQAVSSGCSIAASKWHGTAISGIIGATSHNATGIAGGAPSVAMLPVRVTGKCGGYVADLIDGIRWSAGLEIKGVADNPHPADVINLSVGFPGQCSNAMQGAINDAVDAGAVVVTASTNSAADLDNTPYSPASCENVITVAATDRAGSITSYSALGESVFMSAPGGTVTDGIVTTQNDGSELPLARSAYGSHYGTSIAAAHVSAAVANLLSYAPDLSRQRVEELLAMSVKSTAEDPRCELDQCGYGRLDAYEAMKLLADNSQLQEAPADDEQFLEDVPVQLAATEPATVQSDAIVTSAFNDIGTGTLSQQAIVILFLSWLAKQLTPGRNRHS